MCAEWQCMRTTCCAEGSFCVRVRRMYIAAATILLLALITGFVISSLGEQVGRLTLCKVASCRSASCHVFMSAKS